MEQDKIRGYLEELDIPAKNIDEIMLELEKEDRDIAPNFAKQSQDTEIELRLMQETDWRKRAQLAALKISRGLDH